jgi:hypothetical protein
VAARPQLLHEDCLPPRTSVCVSQRCGCSPKGHRIGELMRKDSQGKKSVRWNEEPKEGKRRDVGGFAWPTAFEIVQEGIPTELPGMRSKTDGELLEALEQFNLSKLLIVRNDRGFAVWSRTRSITPTRVVLWLLLLVVLRFLLPQERKTCCMQRGG